MPWWLIVIIITAALTASVIARANKKCKIAEQLKKQHQKIKNALREKGIFTQPMLRSEDYDRGVIRIESQCGLGENIKLIIETSSEFGKKGGTYVYIRHFYENEDFDGLNLSPSYLEGQIIRILRDKYKLGKLIELDDIFDINLLSNSLSQAVREFRSLYELTATQRAELKAARNIFHEKVTHFYSEGCLLIDRIMSAEK